MEREQTECKAVGESKQRKTKPDVYRKKPFLLSSQREKDKERPREFEEAIYRRIARYAALGKHELSKK